jgi:hypothetical protein
MKKKLFLLIPSLALALTSCGNREGEADTGTKDQLYVVTERLPTTRTTTYSEEVSPVLTGDDIESFNPQSGRIYFRNVTYDDLFRRTEQHSRLHFYLGDVFLFDILTGFEPERVYTEPVLFGSRGDAFVPDKFYLFARHRLPDDPTCYLDETTNWEQFIRYLRTAGKLTEDVTPPDMPRPTTPDQLANDDSRSPSLSPPPEQIIRSISVADDVRSYDPATGEILFTSFTAQDHTDGRVEIPSGISTDVRLPFYLGEEPLFYVACVGPYSSMGCREQLVFTWLDGKFYLLNGYPLSFHDPTWEQIRQANGREWREAWDLFIKQLRDAGKIVR